MDSGLRRNDEQRTNTAASSSSWRCKIVILAQARIHLDLTAKWIPACAEMTRRVPSRLSR
jgi:hypothetical protein